MTVGDGGRGVPDPGHLLRDLPVNDFPLYFYRQPKAPDLEIHPPELDLDAVREARIFWMTGTGLSAEPSRAATLAALRVRSENARGESAAGGEDPAPEPRTATVFDLDWRPMFWDGGDHGSVAPAHYREALAHATVAVGNIDECEIATGEREPHAAARALLAAGVELAVVKQGPKGVLAVHRDGSTADVPPLPVEVVNGLGAGDAFGGALCHGLLAGWDIARIMRYANAAGAIVASLACLLLRDALPGRGRAGPYGGGGHGRHRLRAHRSGLMTRARPTAPATPAAPSVRDLVRLRAERPEAIAEAAARRKRRPLLRAADTADTSASERARPPHPGRLMIIAADDPARGALAVGDRALAMANRFELLQRLCLALSRPGVDGVLASADVLDDLLLLGALEDKVVDWSTEPGRARGCHLRAGRPLHRAPARTWSATGSTRKLLLRIDHDDPGSLDTLHAAARTIDAMAAHRLPVFVEPFLCGRVDGRLRNDLGAAAVITSIAIASGLAGTSAYTWLKVPVTEDPDDMAQVMETSTLPAVLLGGKVGDDLDGAYGKWREALRLPTVLGAVVGRSLLYPVDGDVAGAVDTAVSLL
ncbi:5-dehydro-2-deoxygluconokinase [Streptomyces microflavus]